MGGILVAIGMALTGQVEWTEAIKLTFDGLLALFIRDGIAKK